RSTRARKILEHGLACDAGIGVNAGRRRCRRRLGRAAVMHADKGVHAAGRIGDDARAREGFGHQRRHVRVHRPGQILVPGRAELAARHEHHVGKLRQRLDLLALEQIGRDAFDPVAGELLAQARLAEAGNADHALIRRRALGEAGERRPDLSAYAENDDVARKLLQRSDQDGRRRGHHLLEVLHIAQTIGQRIGGLGHPGVLSLNGRGRERACHDGWMLSGRWLGQQGAPRKWRWLQSEPARCCTANATPPLRAPRRRTRRSLATLVKHASPRTILHGEQHVREPAMKVFMFHLMPYAYLDMNYTDKYRAAWVVLPNSYFDPKKGHELYNRYLDELELAAELGFDGISVNEHHQNAYGLMPSPVVMAAALSRRTKNAKIAILGNAFCLREHPLTLAEEHANCITGGRLITGMVRGIGAEYYSMGSNPAFSHPRFQEAGRRPISIRTPRSGRPPPAPPTRSTGRRTPRANTSICGPPARSSRWCAISTITARRRSACTAIRRARTGSAGLRQSTSPIPTPRRAEAGRHIETLFNKFLRLPFQ